VGKGREILSLDSISLEGVVHLLTCSSAGDVRVHRCES
jgi:hypothetical protein